MESLELNGVNFSKNVPVVNFLGFKSIPIILEAPAALQPIATARPTAPSPQIAVVDPGST